MTFIFILLQNLGKIEATPPVVIILIFLCLLFFFIAAVCSGAEQGFSYLDEKDVKMIRAKDNNESRRLTMLLEEPRLLMISLLTSRIISNVLLIFILNGLIDFLVSMALFPTLSVTIKIIVIFFLLALFCEVLPRAYAGQKKLRMAFFAAPLANSLLSIFKPIVAAMITTSDWMSVRVFNKSNEILTMEDLDEAFAEVSDNREDTEERDILRGLIGFEEMVVKQAMVTRLDVLGVPEKAPFAELIEVIDKNKHSKIPIYAEDIDDIIGVINVKDLLPYLEKKDFDWRTVMKPPVFVHEQKLLKNLLGEFQESRSDFAVVADEFGGTSGIITMKDVMEEIVGEIRGEFDKKTRYFKQIAEKEYLFEGKTALSEFLRVLNLPLGFFKDMKGDNESLAGLLLELSGDFPEKGQEIECNGLTFIPEKLDDFRITGIKVILP